uniref:UPAR/Ly6 domain-containing protein n=1 Tax=Syphacia muris TaxID=451379 RepID=A0A0N5AIV4_9BILA
CLYKWCYISELKSCTTPNDCSDPQAECIYSIFHQKSSCCSPLQNATFPSMSTYSLGKFSKLTCNPLQDDGNDSCPTGYECQKSVTNFTKYPNQPNYACCKI